MSVENMKNEYFLKHGSTTELWFIKRSEFFEYLQLRLKSSMVIYVEELKIFSGLWASSRWSSWLWNICRSVIEFVSCQMFPFSIIYRDDFGWLLSKHKEEQRLIAHVLKSLMKNFLVNKSFCDIKDMFLQIISFWFDDASILYYEIDEEIISYNSVE